MAWVGHDKDIEYTSDSSRRTPDELLGVPWRPGGSSNNESRCNGLLRRSTARVIPSQVMGGNLRRPESIKLGAIVFLSEDEPGTEATLLRRCNQLCAIDIETTALLLACLGAPASGRGSGPLRSLSSVGDVFMGVGLVPLPGHVRGIEIATWLILPVAYACLKD